MNKPIVFPSGNRQYLLDPIGSDPRTLLLERRLRLVRQAMTLVELLVVVAIIGVLASLLLPAIQSAREAARRMQCSSNLRQVGLALHTYESSFKQFPESSTGPGKGIGAICSTGFYSWQSSILPQLEQPAIYAMIDFRYNMADECEYMALEDGRIGVSHRNASAASQRISVFLCPSDPTVGKSNMVGDAMPEACSYTGNLGWPPYATGIQGERVAPTNDNGFFGYQSPIQPAPFLSGNTRVVDFLDGLGNTVAVTERLINPLVSPDGIEEVPDQRFVSYCAMGYSTIRPMSNYLECTSTQMFVDSIYSLPIGHGWISGWAPVGNSYLHVLPPNKSSCHLIGGEGFGGHLASPSSRHAGGVHTLYGDGRVNFLVDEIDVTTWWFLGSRNDGNVSD